ncbi:MAG: Fe-S cluster assembly protein SufD [Planctomycetes bacterium]|nr:Fe-S cluster assembly protein SufD [Planctomycetota bacterium]
MAVLEVKTPYHERLAARPPAGDNGWLHRLRAEAAAHFETRGFPTRRDEDWRYTPLTALEKLAFAPAAASAAAAIRAEALDPGRFGGPDGHRLVFVDGRFAPALSAARVLPGNATAASLAAALAADDRRIREHLGRHAAPDATPFVALNAALHEDGAWIHVPRAVSLDAVVHLVFVSTVAARPTDAHPRSLVVLEAGARAAVVEHHLALQDGAYFVNPVTEIALGARAELAHHTVVCQSDQAFHVGYLHADLARDCRFTALSVTTGGALVRNHVNVELCGEDIECALHGLVVGSGAEHLDNQTRIAHRAPRGTSRQLYKAILDERARGVFHGKVYVARGAQQTDAKQANHALLLARAAEMDARPELEIYADDVKCTHGATVGRLDRDALFYLRARGIGKVDAENLLTLAFASDVVERIRLEEVRREVERQLYTKRPQARRIRE